MSSQGAVAGYLLHITPKSTHTQQAYARVLSAFLRVCPLRIKDVRAEHIERYLLSLKYSNSTKNLHLSVLCSFFNWVNINYDIRNPARKVEFFTALPPYQRIISKEEYHELITKNPEQIRNYIVLLGNTGLRAQEFVNLSMDCIRGDFLYVIGKCGKERAIPLNSAVKEILPHLNFPKSTKVLWRMCQKAAHNAGIKPFSAHSLRHFFATQLYKKGIRLSIISKLLGHSSIVTTQQIYVHLLNADLVGTTDVLL